MFLFAQFPQLPEPFDYPKNERTHRETQVDDGPSDTIKNVSFSICSHLTRLQLPLVPKPHYCNHQLGKCLDWKAISMYRDFQCHWLWAQWFSTHSRNLQGNMNWWMHWKRVKKKIMLLLMVPRFSISFMIETARIISLISFPPSVLLSVNIK